MGAAEPLKILNDGESGPKLDLGLLSRELGIIDNLLIQDPLDEIDSLLVSSSECSRPKGTSSCLKIECLRPLLCCASTRIVEARARNVGVGFEMELVAGRAALVSSVIAVELVPGREPRGEAR